MMRISYLVPILMIALSACGGSTPATTAAPGIEGTWSAPLSPNGSFVLELHPGPGCAPGAACALTGTFRDTSNGSQGQLTAGQLNGNAVHLESTIGLKDSPTYAKCDTTLNSSGLQMAGTCSLKGIGESTPRSFQLTFTKQ